MQCYTPAEPQITPTGSIVHTTPSQDNAFGPCQIAPRAYFAVALGVAAVALPRFAHTTPDSDYYVALAAYFLGELPKTALQTPFAFRWVVPGIAAWIPGVSPATAIALCSLGATMAACLCFARLLTHFVADRNQWRAGMAALVLSFPTLNYGAAVLTDSAGFLVLVAAAWAMYTRRFLALGLVLVAGVGVRESTLLMVPVLWLFLVLERDHAGLRAALWISLGALLAVVAARWWFADLPAYFWTPTWHRFAGNMTRPISWITTALTLVPVGAMALLGLRQWRWIPPRTRHFILATALPCLALLAYSVVAAFMSGRFCWPLYLALVPLAAWAVRARA